MTIAAVIFVGTRIFGSSSGDPTTGATPPGSLSLQVAMLGQSKGEQTYAFPTEAADKAAEFSARIQADDDAYRGESFDEKSEFGWYAGNIKIVLELTNSYSSDIDILAIRPVKRQRSPIKLGSLIWTPVGGAGPEEYSMWVGMDHPQPLARSGIGIDGDTNDQGFFESRLIGLTPGQRTIFNTYFYAESAAFSFDIEVEYRAAGSTKSATEVINNEGRHFRVTAWPCPAWLQGRNVTPETVAEIGALRYQKILKKTGSKDGNGWQMLEIDPNEYSQSCNR